MRILLLLTTLLIATAIQAQNFRFSRTIIATDTITDEGVTFAASSDDAEQENDEIDALFDDDIDAGWEGEPDDLNILTAGLRFQNIFIPKGAKIDSAYIIVYSHEAKTAEDVARITIVADATDNAETFTEDALIDARPQTNASLLWEVNEPWGLWSQERTPDLSAIVQEIVDRDGWEAGNSIAFLLLGEDQGPSEVENAREFESFENIADPEDGGDGTNHPERVPELVIFYSTESALVEVPIIKTTVVTDDGVTFDASSDDAEQENDEIDALFDDDIDAGWEGEPDDLNILTAGLRFQNLAIPQGATIDSAFIEVFSHEAKTAEDVARITVVADATDNAETFTEDALIDARPQTNASLLWVVDEPWGLWSKERTPDLSTIVQEIVDRDGWEVGNSIAFLLLGEDQGPSEVENAREFESFENIADPEDGGDGTNHPERVPELVIFYSTESALVEVPIIKTTVVTDDGVTFDASSDDAEQENDEIDALFDDDIDAGWEGEPDDLNILTAGLRFQNLAIPQGATIDSAFIEVFSHEAKTAEDVARITVVADATDNAETFTEDALIDARPQTNASLLWVVDEPWGLWSKERTPDLSAIVQEIVDRDGWEVGNSIAFLLLGEDQGPSEVENAREFESFENIADPEDGGDGQNHPERVPRLFVYFSSGNTISSTEKVLSIDTKSLTIYPNPADEFITIELESAAKATLRIFDASGRLVKELQHTYGQQIQLNTSNINAGVYYLQVQQEGELFVQKLVVE